MFKHNLNKKTAAKGFVVHHALFAQNLLQCYQLSQPIEFILIFIEYAQLIIQIMYLTHKVSSYSSSEALETSSIMKVIDSISIGFYWGNEQSNANIFLFVLITSYTIVWIICILYMHIANIRRKKQSPRIIRFIGISLRVHEKITFNFVITLICGWLDKTMMTFSAVKETKKIVNIVLAIILLSLNCILAIISNYLFPLILPSKQAFGAKNNTGELVVIAQKIANSILFNVLSDRSLVSGWIASIINLLVCSFHGRTYFVTLPNYNVDYLMFKGRLIALAFTLSLAFVVTTFTTQLSGDEFHLVLMMVIWIITTLFSQGIFTSIMEKRFVSILLCPSSNSTLESIIQKVIMLKDFHAKAITFQEYNKKVDFRTLVLNETNARRNEIFRVPIDLMTQEISFAQKNKVTKKIIAASLEDALSQATSNNEKNEYFRLFCAYYFGRKLKHYGAAIKLLEDLERNIQRYMIRLNVLILKYQLEEDIKSNRSQETTGLRLFDFIIQTDRFELIKKEMLTQADVQSTMCQEWQGSGTFDLGVLQKCSHKIEQHKIHIKKRLSRLFEKNSDYFMEPLIAAAYYSALINFSPIDFGSYFKNYTLRMIKYQTKFTKSELNIENVYHKNTFTLLISTSNNNFGTIVSCSANIAQAFGWSKDSLIGRTLFSILPHSFIKIYYFQMRKFFDVAPKDFVKKSSILFILHPDGYLIPSSFEPIIYPSLSQGLFFQTIIRPLTTTKEYIVISKNGTIEAFTKNIGAKLNLSPLRASDISIESLNSQLRDLDVALNTIAMEADIAQNREDQKQDSYKHSTTGMNPIMPSEDRLLSQPVTNCSHNQRLLTNRVLSPRITEIPMLSEAITPDTPRDRFGNMKEKITDPESSRRLMNKLMPLDKAQTLYTEYSSKGRLLKLAPLTITNGKKGDRMIPRHVTYLCNVQLIQHASSSVKILLLQREFDKEDPDAIQLTEDLMTSEASYKFGRLNEFAINLKAKNDNNYRNKTSVSDLNSEEFGEQKEDFHNENSIRAKGRAPEATETNVFRKSQVVDSDHTTLNKIFSSQEEVRKLAQEKKVIEKDQALLNSSGSPQQETNEGAIAALDMRLSKEISQKRDRQNSLQSHATSSTKIFDEKRIYKTLQVSLNLKHYPKIFFASTFLFLLLIAVFIISQTMVSFDVKNHFETLNWQKEITVNARSRTDLTLRFQRRLRVTWTMGMNITSETYLNQFSPNLKAVMLTFSNSEVTQLMLVNKNLAIDTSFLDLEQSKVLFSPNVKFYDRLATNSKPESYIYLTNFQAVDKLYAQAIRIIATSKTNLTAALPKEELLFKNALNNVLVQNRKTVDVISSYLLKNKDKFITQSVVIMNLTPILLCVYTFFFIIFTKKAYNREVSTLINVSKISQESVRLNVDQLVKFKDVISKAAYYEDTNLNNVTNFSRSLFRFNQEVKNYTGKNEKKVQKYYIRRKYVRYLLTFLIYLMFMIALIMIKLSWFLTNTSKMYEQVEKLNFIKEVEEEISLAVACYVEVVLGNATETILNTPSEDFYFMQMNKLDDVWLELSDKFLNKNDNTDSYIQNVLTTDACQYVGASLLSACTKLTTGSKETGLLKFLIMFKKLFKGTVDSFLSSSRTASDTQRIFANVIGLTVPYTNIVTALLENISSSMEADFTNMHETLLFNNKIYIVAYPCIILVLSMLFWCLSLTRIKEVENDLKKVLKCFSVNTVVKVYGLKLFLLETSNGIVNAIKNDF